MLLRVYATLYISLHYSCHVRAKLGCHIETLPSQGILH